MNENTIFKKLNFNSFMRLKKIIFKILNGNNNNDKNSMTPKTSQILGIFLLFKIIQIKSFMGVLYLLIEKLFKKAKNVQDYV